VLNGTLGILEIVKKTLFLNGRFGLLIPLLRKAPKRYATFKTTRHLKLIASE
jgi:hypothetical protein